jgi:hypothetical protein
MSAEQALKAAHDAGVSVSVDGDMLLLRAAAPPPTSIVDALTLHKNELLGMFAENKQQKYERLPLEPTTTCISDETGPEAACEGRRGRVEMKGDVVLHYCLVCGAWGAFGTGVKLRAGQLGRWYCAEHRPQKHHASSQGLKRDAIAAGYVQPWQPTYAKRRSKYASSNELTRPLVGLPPGRLEVVIPKGLNDAERLSGHPDVRTPTGGSTSVSWGRHATHPPAGKVRNAHGVDLSRRCQ